uniref:Flagellar protein FliL n=1 Tax=Thermodesulfobacterium geofontis TaxID=1295609 RepID=A0A7V5XIA5_9BACT
MAEEAKTETQEKEVKKVSKKKLLLLLVMGLVIIVLAGSVIAVLSTFKGSKEKEKEKSPKETVIYSMEPIVVNLFDPTGKRYLQVRLAFELKDKKVEEEIKINDPKIRDIIISTLSTKTPEDVLQPEAKDLIKAELLQKINSALGEEALLNIYITQYIVE